MSDVKILASGFGFPEGPAVMPDGAVILTEIRNGRCSRVTADGKASVFSECGGGPNGLAIGPDGALYLCNNGGARYVEGTSMSQGAHTGYKGGSIQRLDARTGEARTLYTECDGHKLSAPNDLVFDTAGGFYFTDLGKRFARHRDHGGLYYAQPDGSKITCIAYPILSPNGCALSPDGKVLYVADTGNHALRRINLLSGQVDTLCGTGRAGEPVERQLSQPWDSPLPPPTGVTLAENQVLIAMAGDTRIWSYDLGTHTLRWRAGGGGIDVRDGSGHLAAFAQPTAVVAVQQVLYVCDALGSAVRSMQLRGDLVQTLLGQGAWEFGNQDGPRGQAKLQFPQAIAHSAEAPVLWIADTGNGLLRTVRLGGG